MRLLDRYILKKFLSTYFFVVMILLAVITVIDLTEKMDKYAEANLSAMVIIAYYVDYIAWIGNLITPITIFIATVYVCSQMAGHTEIIAILSSGVSFKRMLLPFFIGSLFVAMISFVLNGWIIPNSNKDMVAFELQYFKSRYNFDKQNVHIQIAPNTIMYLQSYQNASRTGYHFTLDKYDGNRLLEKLTASRIVWDSTKLKWTAYDWRIDTIDYVFEKFIHGDSVSKSNNALLVHNNTLPDSIVLPAKGETSSVPLDTALAINPSEFESDYRRYEGLTFNELSDYIRTLQARGSAGIEVYQVEFHARIASVFTIFILVFMGVIVSSRKSRGGTGLQIALGFLLSFVFIVFFMLFRTFAEKGAIPPQISVWIPSITFAIIAGVMYRFMPR